VGAVDFFLICLESLPVRGASARVISTGELGLWMVRNESYVFMCVLRILMFYKI